MLTFNVVAINRFRNILFILRREHDGPSTMSTFKSLLLEVYTSCYEMVLVDQYCGYVPAFIRVIVSNTIL